MNCSECTVKSGFKCCECSAQKTCDLPHKNPKGEVCEKC